MYAPANGRANEYRVLSFSDKASALKPKSVLAWANDDDAHACTFEHVEEDADHSMF